MTAARIMSWSISTSSGSMADGSMVRDLMRMSPAAVTLTAPQPAVELTSVSAAFCWAASNCSCIFRACCIIWLRFMPPMLNPLDMAWFLSSF